MRRCIKTRGKQLTIRPTAHSRRHLLFDNRIRSGRVAQSWRQAAAGSGEAERGDSLQTRWNGPRHEAMGR